MNRRSFLLLAGIAGAASLLGACASPAAPAAAPPATQPAAAPPAAQPAVTAPASAPRPATSAPLPAASAPPAAAASWQAEWDALVAAARKEGKVSIVTRAGAGMRQWMKDFETAFPGIAVQHQQFPSPSQFIPKVTEEQKAGVYEWDLYQTYALVAVPLLRPIDGLAPVRPMIFKRPDILDDKNWSGGFEAGWQDNDKQWGYGFSYQVNGLIALNTDLVQPGEIKSVDDMLNPKWKAKMAFPDVRSGKTFGPMFAIRESRGDDVVKRLLIDQQPFFSQDIRQIVESVVRGRSALALGLFKQDLREFVDQGLAKNIQLVDIPDVTFLSSDAIFALSHTPHPNAASLLASWILTRDGQASSIQNAELPTRRTDIPSPPTPDTPKAGQHYVSFSSEDAAPRSVEIQKFLATVMNH